MKRKCVDCGVAFEPQSRSATRCFSCFNLKRYRDSKNPANFVKSPDGCVVEASKPDSVRTEAKNPLLARETAQLDLDAQYLRKCWDVCGYCGDAKAREGLAVTLFLTRRRNA